MTFWQRPMLHRCRKRRGTQETERHSHRHNIHWGVPLYDTGGSYGRKTDVARHSFEPLGTRNGERTTIYMRCREPTHSLRLGQWLHLTSIHVDPSVTLARRQRRIAGISGDSNHVHSDERWCLRLVEPVGRFPYRCAIRPAPGGGDCATPARLRQRAESGACGRLGLPPGGRGSCLGLLPLALLGGSANGRASTRTGLGGSVSRWALSTRSRGWRSMMSRALAMRSRRILRRSSTSARWTWRGRSGSSRMCREGRAPASGSGMADITDLSGPTRLHCRAPAL